jgi:hypothetical protein
MTSVAGPALQYFSTVSHKQHGFKKEALLEVKGEFFLYKFV